MKIWWSGTALPDRRKDGEMTFEQIIYTVDDRIARVTLNRPDHMNAVTLQMLDELREVFDLIDRDDRVRAVVVTGAGDAFCAGADISEGARTFEPSAGETGTPVLEDLRDPGGRLTLRIFNCKKPVIAAVNGHAVGIGITMVLPMDIRIAAEDARIGFVFTRRGVVPEACSSWFLPRIVGISKAAEWVLRGRVFTAGDEADAGLFNYVVPREQVLSRACAMAAEIAENTAPVSVALSRALLWRGLTSSTPHDVHPVDTRCFYWAGTQPDAHEGILSFLEKRPPEFTMKPSSDMPYFYPWWDESGE